MTIAFLAVAVLGVVATVAVLTKLGYRMSFHIGISHVDAWGDDDEDDDEDDDLPWSRQPSEFSAN